MSKASEELEARRRERGLEEFKRKWWWFDPANKKHIHEFSVSWEILRRTKVYRQLQNRIRAVCGTIGNNPRYKILQKGAAMNSFRDIPAGKFYLMMTVTFRRQAAHY